MELNIKELREKIINESPQGRPQTKALFFEENQGEGTFDPIFSLKRYDLVKGDKTYWSLYKIYMSYEHLPGHEYDFALEVLGSWKQWDVLCSSPIIGKHITEWRDEMEIKIRAKAMKSLIDTALNEGAKGAAYAKYLSEAGWRGTGRGRPSKQEVERELKIATGMVQAVDADLDRIGLKLVKGGK